jgi:hypothetical protein
MYACQSALTGDVYVAIPSRAFLFLHVRLPICIDRRRVRRNALAGIFVSPCYEVAEVFNLQISRNALAGIFVSPYLIWMNCAVFVPVMSQCPRGHFCFSMDYLRVSRGHI